jgi:hypothetical protein
MTTGRINQVTTLNPRGTQRGRVESHPEGRPSIATRKECTGRCTQPEASRRAEREGPPVTIHLPPLGSPRGGPPRWSSSPRAARYRCIRPSSGGVPSPCHAARRLLVRACPRGSEGRVAIGQPSTDPKKCAHSPEGWQDFCSRGRPRPAAWNYPAQCRCADQSGHSQPLPRERRGLLRYQGLPPCDSRVC